MNTPENTTNPDTAFKEALAALQDAQRALSEIPKADHEAREAARLAVADASARAREAKDAKKRLDELRNYAGLATPLALVLAQRFPPDVVAELNAAAVAIVEERQRQSAERRAAKAAAQPPPTSLRAPAAAKVAPAIQKRADPPPPRRLGPEVYITLRRQR